MEVTNGHFVPHELLRIAYYYVSPYPPLAIRAFINDPFAHPFSKWYKRKGTMGEYCSDGNTVAVHLFLRRVQLFNSFARFVPPPMCFWLGLLEVLLHEIRHHLQVYESDAARHDDYGQGSYRRSWPERDARQFAFREIKRLAELDDDLFMPWHSADMGYLGAVTSRWLKAAAKEVREHPDRWVVTHMLREAKERAVHVGHRNPLAHVAESDGVVWQDKRGHKYRYLRLGQAVRMGLLDAALAESL